MTTSYPSLARFLAGRWATGAVRIVPVFGEKGALLEHWVFDAAFNYPRVFAKWARPRMGLLLTFWALFGIALAANIFTRCPASDGIDLVIVTIAVFILPRTLFYPLLAKRRRK
jgi:hypothetical protein